MKLRRYRAAVVIAAALGCACSTERPADPRPASGQTPSSPLEAPLPSAQVSGVDRPLPPATQEAAPAPKPSDTKRVSLDERPVGTTTMVVDGVKVNADAAVMANFKERVGQYVVIHNKAAKDAPPLKTTNEPAKIKVGENGLADEIRTLRAGAKSGDIFTPEIRDVFRRLLYPELKGDDGRDAKDIMKDDAPASVPLKVNADYPEGAPLPTVPANLLANLPPLPKEVEYRIINKHLILRDVSANLIVDYVPNVIR